ncbi:MULTISPECIES: TfpX/TfpZ family type IV pilin accessory protein [Polaromonas]|uniref:TfpX/TfpZ family type IV pilin accessory protein n=2 Tax=Polaromonas TaxID=52972 RepID=A0ABW1TVK7_9BURK
MPDWASKWASCSYRTFTSKHHHKTMFENPDFLKGRLKASGIHLGISLTLAILAALLVFLVWYPYPYREISGGRELFLLLVTVDVIMGPLLTLAIFNRNKPRKTLQRDLAVIGLLQLSALAYGLWTMAAARPVHLAFEIDRFRVVHAVDIPPDMLSRAPADLQQLPLTGPTLLSVRDFKDAKENFDATMAALQGVALGARPDLWQSYEKAKPQVLARARPLAELKTRFPDHTGDIDRALQSASASARPGAAIGYIPMVGRSTFWTVLIDANTAEVIAFVPLDSF